MLQPDIAWEFFPALLNTTKPHHKSWGVPQVRAGLAGWGRSPWIWGRDHGFRSLSAEHFCQAGSLSLQGKSNIRVETPNTNRHTSQCSLFVKQKKNVQLHFNASVLVKIIWMVRTQQHLWNRARCCFCVSSTQFTHSFLEINIALWRNLGWDTKMMPSLMKDFFYENVQIHQLSRLSTRH